MPVRYPNGFRQLFDDEANLISRCRDKGIVGNENPIPVFSDDGKLSIQYIFQPGGFCICILRTMFSLDDPSQGDFMWIGVSRRSSKDRQNNVKGKMLALRRAVLFSDTIRTRQ